jgi:hypothetical protein
MPLGSPPTEMGFSPECGVTLGVACRPKSYAKASNSKTYLPEVFTRGHIFHSFATMIA